MRIYKLKIKIWVDFEMAVSHLIPSPSTHKKRKKKKKIKGLSYQLCLMHKGTRQVLWV